MPQEQHTNSNTQPLKDKAKFWRAERYDDLECLRATFVKHDYPKHMHDTFAIGVIERGAEKFYANGENHIAQAGRIALFNPHVVHDGKPDGDGFSYRVTYPSIELMNEVQHDLLGKIDTIHFNDLILNDDYLAQRFLAFHNVLEYSNDSLEQDSAFTTILSELIQRHGDLNFDFTKAGMERLPIKVVRECIDDLFASDLNLDDLAELSQLNRHHLLRTFRKELGLTPHAYQTMRRVQAAKQKLERGDLPIQVAIDCGFFDQSHMSRIFKKHVGLSPGQYSKLFRKTS